METENSQILRIGSSSRMIGASRVFIENQPIASNENCIGENRNLGKQKNEECQKPRAARFNWTPELQQKFKYVCETLGDHRATPMRIKRLINEPKLTIHSISSYLQKYRAKVKAEKEAMKRTTPTCIQKKSSAPCQLNCDPSSSKKNCNNIQTDGNPPPNFELNYHNIQTDGNLMQNASFPSFMANASNIVDEDRYQGIQGIQGNIGPVMQPLEPIPTSEAPNMVYFQNNIGDGTFIPEYYSQTQQEMNGGLGGYNLGELACVPGKVPQVQEQSGGLGIEGETINMEHVLTDEDIQNIQQLSHDGSSKDASSLGGCYASTYGVPEPFTPSTWAETGWDIITQNFNRDLVDRPSTRAETGWDIFPENSSGDLIDHNMLLIQNASISNFMANTSNVVDENLYQGIQGNIEPIPTSGAINNLQVNGEALNMVYIQNNIGDGEFIAGLNPQAPQEMNGCLGGFNLGVLPCVPGKDAQVQEQSGGLGIEGDAINMEQVLTDEEIQNIQQLSQDDSSLGGYAFACGVPEPFTPSTWAETGWDIFPENSSRDLIDHDMFLNVMEYVPNFDVDFMYP